MEPRIQYARTEDGVNIAYWTLGEGEPLVHMPWAGVSHLQLDWQYPEYRRWYERLSDGRKLVRYDGRGTGLSDRDLPRFSLDACVLDLETIVDRLQLERFALFGLLHSAPLAIAYAARHRERVSHLILWCPYASESDYLRSSPQLQALRQVAATDWDTYMELAANLSLGWSEGAEARRWSAYTRECYTQEMWQRIVGVASEFDVTDLLSQITAPTLVLHRRQAAFPAVEVARRLAAEIPDARFTLLDGTSIVPFLGDAEAVLGNITEFLDEGRQAKTSPAPPEPSAVHTILFTDIEGSTALTQKLGDAAARDVFREHERVMREALRAHGGSEVKAMGDGFMASFGSATKALECAIAIQRAFDEPTVGARHPGGHSDISQSSVAASAERGSAGGGASPLRPEHAIRVRIGLNAGEPIAEDDDLHGTAVITAARIAALAQGGEILVSDVVRQLVAGKGFLFSDRGDHALKGFEDPVRVWEARWQEE